MSFQTRKTSVHLLNTNEDIFDGIWELSDPPIDSKDPYRIKDHVTSVCQLEFYETTRILFAQRKQK